MATQGTLYPGVFVCLCCFLKVVYVVVGEVDGGSDSGCRRSTWDMAPVLPGDSTTARTHYSPSLSICCCGGRWWWGSIDKV